MALVEQIIGEYQPASNEVSRAMLDASPAVIVPGDLGANIASFRRSLAASNLAPRTVQTYVEGVTRFGRYLGETGMPGDVAAIRREHVESFMEHLLATGKPSSAANRYRSLQAFFKWAVEDGEIKDSPMAKMRPPKIPQNPPPVLRDAELRKLLATCSGQSLEDRRDTAILTVFIGTGARLAEVAGLRWAPDDETTNDVLLDAGIIRVMGKGRRERTVPVGKKGVKALDRYLRARDKSPSADLPWLWLGRRGRLTASGIAQMVKDRGRAAGLGNIHPHQFRHSYAHSMLGSGMQESDVMALAGWSSPEMLRRYAASTRVERAHEAARRINPADRL
jgi:site-specific recombinase XerD